MSKPFQLIPSLSKWTAGFNNNLKLSNWLIISRSWGISAWFLNKKSRLQKSASFFFTCTPAEARTLDTLIKSQVLYQLSYGCIVFRFAGAKVVTFCETTK